MNVEWKFRAMTRGEMNVDPIEGEFFTTEALGSITDALVRESIQNSLDAADGSGPVTVCFSFFSMGRDQSEETKELYLDGLMPHVQAKNAGLQELPSPQENLDYILIEDYGTRGLQGDILQYDDLDDDIKKNDFYYFWRNIGRTRKGSTDLGRWGLGKTVFQAASRINSFFGLTVRKDDGRTLLMGQSVLKIHRVGPARFAPYGYFGIFMGDLALPVEDDDYLENFSRSFSMERSGKPGLTIVVPYPDREIEPVDCIKSVIRHYFFPILSGDLIFEIKHSRKHYRLDAITLDKVLKKSRLPESQGLLGLLDLARWAIKQPEDSFIQLKEPEPGRAPKLRENLFDPEQLEKIKQRFADGERLAFSVPVSIQRLNSKEIKHAGFSLFIERDESLDRAEDHFIRQGITIPEVSSLKHKGIRAIVSITECELSTFLGDAENPAHTEWERNSKKFKKRYKLGPSTLDFVKSSPREIVKILNQPKKGRDENLLKHIFSLPLKMPDQTGRKEREAPGQGDKKVAKEHFVEVAGETYLQLSPIKSGFRLTKRSHSEKVPRIITIWVAYEVRSGNPFQKYTPLDFDVSRPPIQIQAEGAKILLNKHNVIQVEVQNVNFKLAVTGFDMHRDLRIKTTP